MALVYDNAIPQATDALSTSQPQILTNFASIESWVDVDHVDFADANYGQHNKVTFPVQSSAPSIAMGSIGLFNLNSSLTTNNELFITNSVGVSYPVTADDAATTGWCYLPSGLLVKWGITAATGDDTITLPTAATIPVFSGVITAQATVQGASTDANLAVALVTITTTTIEVYLSNRTTTGAATGNFTYLIIGY